MKYEILVQLQYYNTTFRPEHGATRCVANRPPAANAEGNRQPCPHVIFFSTLCSGGRLAWAFRGSKYYFASDPVFSSVSDVPSPPCFAPCSAPSRPFHMFWPGPIHPEHQRRVLLVLEQHSNLQVSLNVARHRHHRPLATHPKLLLMLFPDP